MKHSTFDSIPYYKVISIERNCAIPPLGQVGIYCYFFCIHYGEFYFIVRNVAQMMD